MLPASVDTAVAHREYQKLKQQDNKLGIRSRGCCLCESLTFLNFGFSLIFQAGQVKQATE